MCKTLALSTVAVGLVLAVASTGAVGQDNVFALSYFSNAHTRGAPDAVLRLVNDGTLSDASPAGDLCASIYVFDSIEELSECCSCRITPNGILSLSVNTNLTHDPLTGKTLTRGIVKVVSSKVSGAFCDPNVVAPQIGIRGWITHVQQPNRSFSITEDKLTDSTYGSAESADLAEDCMVLTELANSTGVCSCIDSNQ